MTSPYDDYKMYGSTPSGRSRSYAYYVTSKKPGGFQYHVSCSVVHAQLPELLSHIRINPTHIPAIRAIYNEHFKKLKGPDADERLAEMDKQVDKRLVRTFLKALEAIITFRHSVYGLLLSELGGYILSAEQAPAGTKRLSNLLRSNKWTARVIEDFLWKKATEQVELAEGQQEAIYIGWDESVVEKRKA